MIKILFIKFNGLGILLNQLLVYIWMSERLYHTFIKFNKKEFSGLRKCTFC